MGSSTLPKTPGASHLGVSPTPGGTWQHLWTLVVIMTLGGVPGIKLMGARDATWPPSAWDAPTESDGSWQWQCPAGRG